jgi:hypothetical protein
LKKIWYIPLHQLSRIMGYMGFGMRKEDWSRKPKEAFKKTKDRYGNRRGHVTLPQGGLEPVSTNFDELARFREEHARRFNRGASISKLIFGLGILLLGALLFYAMIKASGHQ